MDLKKKTDSNTLITIGFLFENNVLIFIFRLL